jgi:putative aminopeptidase FrvX
MTSKAELMPLDPAQLLQELVLLPGPPGQEEPVRDYVAAKARALGCVAEFDLRGNLLISAPGAAAINPHPKIVVMAHLDEIAMIVERVDDDGRLKVAQLGALLPWKLGEGPVTVLGERQINGVLSFGSIHTASPTNPIVKARETTITFETIRVFTGLTKSETHAAGVGPGTRVVVGLGRRALIDLGDYIAAPFLDDRADLAAMLLALESLSQSNVVLSDVVFAATVAEEVGGHGALYLLRNLQPEIGIALEIGPRVPETPIPFDGSPTVWVNDSYSAMTTHDIELTEKAASDKRLKVHRQALSRGGSDASCAASHGLLARCFTLAFLAENSHGYEITHRDSVVNLSRLTCAVLERLTGMKH